MNDSEVLTLREWRRKRLLTQEELAAKVGVTFTTISNWETGEAPPRVRNIRKLAEALSVAPEQIIFPPLKPKKVAA